ncbi:MAG: hypothetical protein CMA72_07045 [Euryarchaeota archaeon]|nr:hypothetical protein [Euryarchaeota archaeon]
MIFIEEMFTFLTDRIASVRAHTSLLEACDWDDEVAERVVKDLDRSLASFSGASLSELTIHVRKDLREKYDDEIVKQVLDLMKVEVSMEVRELQITRGEA